MKKRKTLASKAVHNPRNLAIQLRATGGVDVVEIGEDPALSKLHEIVGGYIEGVALDLPVSDPIVMLCDEEGKIKDKPVNNIASAIMAAYPFDYCVGDALILAMDGDDLVGLTESQMTVLKAIVGQVARKHGCGVAL